MFVTFLKKTVAFLKNSRARWKTHSFRGNDVCVIVIKHLSACAKTVQRPVVPFRLHLPCGISHMLFDYTASRTLTF